MQNNSLVQIKLKANQFIQDYQRQVTQREYQKQKLKQNIMLQIMSNRHKSQSSQSVGNDIDKIDSISNQARFKKSIAVTISDNREKQRNMGVSGVMRSNSVPNVNNGEQEEDSQNLYQPAEITFKMSKNKNNNFNFADSKIEPKNYEEDEEVQVCENQIQQKQCLDENQTLRQAKPKSNKIIEIEQSRKSKLLSNLRNQKQDITQRSQRFKNRIEEVRPKQEDSQTERRQNIEQEIQIIERKPIFLTLDEDQSVEMSQENKNKNYAFDISMEKSEPIEDIEELRKKKIEEMEKKRQQRLEEFRKQEEIKRLNSEEKPQNKRSNSYLKGRGAGTTQNSKTEDDFQQQNPKSKSRRKVQKDQKNTSIHNIVQQSHYNMKPPQPQRSSYVVPLQRQDYQQTPKTIVSEHRIDKSKGKNTIFRQSPKRADKSASKYSQDPKIQPKQRKNTFNKQSNKKLMITALTNVCLPGQINRKDREKLAQVIEKQQSQFFVFLFKEYSRKVIKAIYTLDSSQTFLQKIYGEKAPQQIFSQNVQSFYRFDSGSREFKKLDGCKSFSLVVHAIDLA